MRPVAGPSEKLEPALVGPPSKSSADPTDGIKPPLLSSVSTAPALVLSSGSLEALKWLALLLMTLDHVNKYLLHASVPELFATGRLALPLFGCVLGYNLARPGALASGAYARTARRLAAFGGIATLPFIALGGLGWWWWPLNIMATLLVATVCAWLIDVGGTARLLAAATLFIVGGALVEFWWPGVAACLLAWAYCRRPSWLMLALWVGALASLYLVNRNLWALAAVPLIFAARHIGMKVPRRRLGFYVYYPVHLTVIWGVARLL
jgi:TraX protein